MSYARVRFDLNPEETNGVGDLPLTKGEVVKIIEKSHTGLWKLERKDGTVGIVPSNYIQVIPSDQPVLLEDSVS
jgi:hypothetical protein